MLIPIYKKKHKQINVKGTGKFLNKIKFGFYGIRTLEKGILLVKQLETIRLFVSRISKRVSKIFIRVFFIQPLTKKPLKSRMGKGVGIIKLWIAYVKKGTIFFELSNISKKLAMLIFKRLNFTLSLKLNFVSRKVFIK